MVDWNKNNILKIAGVVIFVILLGVYTIGIAVPLDSPYVKFEILPEKEHYIVGESAMARFLIKNEMPFPIKITITETFYKKGHYSNETTGFTASQFEGKEKPYEIKLGAFEVLGESHSCGLNMSRSGEFVFEYHIGERVITHTVTILNPTHIAQPAT